MRLHRRRFRGDLKEKKLLVPWDKNSALVTSSVPSYDLSKASSSKHEVPTEKYLEKERWALTLEDPPMCPRLRSKSQGSNHYREVELSPNQGKAPTQEGFYQLR